MKQKKQTKKISTCLGEGRAIFIQRCYWEDLHTLSVRVPYPNPVLDKNRAPMGPEMLSNTWAGVWRKAPKAFPDSNSALDKFCEERLSELCLK